jgi:membrane protease YdiL (CAAX protease family)
VVETEPVPDVLRRRFELRVLVAFAYCALVLTLLEYKFLSARVLASGWLSGSAPADRQLYASLIWAGATITFFLVIPAVIVLLWHRERLASVGFSLTGVGRHLPVYLGLFALMFPILLWASRRPDFLETYPFVKRAVVDRQTLLIWESAYVLQFAALESFFRGYLLFTAARVIPRAAIGIAAAPYTMIHFHKPFPECLSALGAGLLLGFLALRYRSFVGGIVLHALVAVTMDVLAVRQAAG